MSRHERSRSGMLVGLTLIVLGFLFLLGNFKLVGIGEVIVTWWPLILIVIAVSNLASPGGRRSLGPYVMLALGLVFLGIQLDLVTWRIFGYLWPVILILIGLRVIFGPVVFRVGLKPPGVTSGHSATAMAILGGTESRVTSQQFRGGEAMALLGGVHLDLRQARLDPADANLNVTALFGSVEIIVPEGWHVVTRGTPILGSLENKLGSAAQAQAPTLWVDAFVCFGGVEIHS